MKNLDSYQQYKNLLKKYVLAKAGRQVISPGDCKLISATIENATGKVISETTLKRFLGFAKQHYNFSTFTLNTLCEFTGFEGWENFCHTAPPNGEGIDNCTMWEEFRKKAMEVTRMTQETLKNLSGVPFAFTVSRPAMEADFNYFLESDYQFFCLIGAPGMGKSIQMCHIAENFFLKENAPYRKSIVWSGKNSTFRDISPFNINPERPFQEPFNMGKEFNFLEYFYHHPDEVKGKVVFMMDGFDEYFLESTHPDHTFQKITDLLSSFKGLNWLKIVLALRSSTWMLLQEKIEQSEYLKRTWFSGFFYQKELKSNLMPLSKHEISRVIKAIHKDANISFTQNNLLYSLFSCPYYLSLYYQLIKNDGRASLRGNALFCELISSFVFHKVSHSRYSIEKNRLLQKFVELTDYGKSDAVVKKRELLDGNDSYILAYNELISEGILQEKDSGKAFNYELYVQFVQEPLFTYFIVQVLMNGSNLPSGLPVMQKVINEYSQDEKQDMLLKWILWHFLLKNAKDISDIFSSTALSPTVKGDLLIFICDLLEGHPGIMDEVRKKALIKISIAFMAEHFLELDHLGKEYEEAINTLLNYTTCPVHEADLLIMLAILAIIRFDRNALSQAIMRLGNLDREIFIARYPLNPLPALEFIFGHYSNRSTEQSFPAEIDAFIKNPPDRSKNKTISPEDMLSYQLTAFIVILCRPPKQIIAFTDVIKLMYPDLFFVNPCSGMTTYLLIRQAFAYLRCSMKIQAGRIMDQLQKCHEFLYDEKNCSHSTLLFEILKGEMAASENNYKSAGKYFLKAYQAGKQSGFTLLQVYAAVPLIKMYKLQNEFDKAFYTLDNVRKTLRSIDFPIEDLLLRKMTEKA